jgi:hypothetical protein
MARGAFRCGTKFPFHPAGKGRASATPGPAAAARQEIASNLHFSKQVMHLTHLAVSIRATSFFFQAIASAGQARKHMPHLVQISGSISNLSSDTQRLAGQRFSLMCA